MNKVERVVIAGYGSIGRRHARILGEFFPGIEVALFRSGDGTSDGHVDNLRCLRHFDEVVEFDPQAALVSNPSSMHIATARAFLEADVPVLIEKPIADSTEGLSSFLELVDSKGLTVLVGYNLRFLPTMIYFKKMLEEKICGEVYSVRSVVGQHLAGWRPGTDYRHGVSAKSSMGGGVLLELSHELDYLQWLFGKVEAVTATVTQSSDLEVDVEDCVHLLLELSVPGKDRPLYATLDMDFFRHDFTRTCTVIGEKGTLEWDGVAGTVRFFDASEERWTQLYASPDERDTSFKDEWTHFLDCVEDRSKPEITGIDGAGIIDLVEMAKRSSERGARVVVNQLNASPEGC